MPGSTSSSESRTRSLPSIDVLIPHHNDIAGLILALASIDAQDWNGQFRVVIADDGSRPEIVADLESLVEKRDARTVLIRNEANRGRPYTRNVLLDAAEGEYLSWLDAGDEWHPSKISAQFNKLVELKDQTPDDVAWITCHYDWQWHGLPPQIKRQRTDLDQMKAILRGRVLRAYLWTLLGSTKSFRDVGWFDQNLPRLQDLDFFIRFLLKGGVLSLPQEDQSFCVYHKSDIGRSADEIRACNAYIFDKYPVLYNRYGASFRREQLYRMEMLSARFAANNNDAAKTRHFMWRAFRMAPKRFVRHVRAKGLRP